MQSIDFSTHGRDIDAVYRKIVTGDESVSWAIFGTGNSGSSYKPIEQGTGDLSEFAESFSEGKVEFGLSRVHPPGSDVTKILLVGWCPDSVSIKSRSSFAQNFATVAKALHGYHVQVTARDEDDLEVDELLKKVSDASGARYSIQSTSKPNFGTKKPAAKPPVSAPKAVSAPKSGSQFIPKPIVPKPVAPKPSSPFVKKSDDDGWGGAEEVKERDLTKQPLENVTPAWKPIGKVDVDAIRSGTTPKPAPVAEPVAEKPKPTRTLPPAPRPVAEVPKPAPAPAPEPVTPAAASSNDDEDLDDDEKAFREKRNIFTNLAKPEPEPVIQHVAKPKPVVAATPKFGGARPGKLPVPGSYVKDKDNLVGGVSKNFGTENGKTAAQIWAEKHGKFDSSASPEPPVNSSSNEPEPEEKHESVGALANKFKEAAIAKEDSSDEEPEPAKIAVPNPVARSVPPAPAAAVRSVPPPPAAAAAPEPEPAPAPAPAPVARAVPPAPTKEPEPETKSVSITAVAQFDFDAGEDTEISLKEGELIVDIEFENEDWWVGKNEAGQVGQFPSNYVQLSKEFEGAAGDKTIDTESVAGEEGIPEHTDLKAVAQYDYTAEEDNELSFKTGDVITDIYQEDEAWWYGTLNGERKLFPSNYVNLEE